MELQIIATTLSSLRRKKCWHCSHTPKLGGGGGGGKGEILLPHLLGELVGSFARCVQHSVVNRLGGFGDMTVKALNCNL